MKRGSNDEKPNLDEQGHSGTEAPAIYRLSRITHPGVQDQPGSRAKLHLKLKPNTTETKTELESVWVLKRDT